MTFPIWYNAIAGKGAYVPDIEIATKDVLGRDQCVMSTDYMRANHMNLLNQWRNDVVRLGERVHIAPDGRKYDRSLSNTCLDCHSNKARFCDLCHNYMGVAPYCWQCHLEPDLMVK
jgi:hypothetical protein